MLVYLHCKCTTCQNALRFLEQNNVTFSVKDITKEPPSKRELEQMLHWQGGNVKKLLNTSGMLYRDMHLAEKIQEMTTDEILHLLSLHGMLVKRPFVIADLFGLVGFKEGEWRQKILSGC